MATPEEQPLLEIPASFEVINVRGERSTILVKSLPGNSILQGR
jgi:hypothetical protein